MPVNVTTLVNGVVRPPSVNIGGKGAKAAMSLKRANDRALDNAAYMSMTSYRNMLRRRGYSNFIVRGVRYAGQRAAKQQAAVGQISRPVRAIFLLAKRAEILSRLIRGGRGSKRLSYVRTTEYEGHIIAPEGERGRRLGGLVRRLKKTSGIAARSARLAVVPRRDGGEGHTIRERGRFRGWLVRQTMYRPGQLQWSSFLRPTFAKHARVAMEKANRRELKRLAKGLVGM